MLVGLFGLVFGMVGLSFAAVPLYDLFCRVTGYGGTTQVAEAAPDRRRAGPSGRSESLHGRSPTATCPGTSQPEQREVTMQVGESGLAFYTGRRTCPTRRSPARRSST